MSSLFITQQKENCFCSLVQCFSCNPVFPRRRGDWWSNDVFFRIFSLAVARPTIRDGHSSRETLSIHLLANEMKINSLSAAHTILNFLIRLSFVFLPGAKIKSVQKCWKKTLWCAKRWEISSVCVPLWEYYFTDWKILTINSHKKTFLATCSSRKHYNSKTTSTCGGKQCLPKASTDSDNMRGGMEGTSVPSERMFSTAGDLVSAHRACLDSGNVNKHVGNCVAYLEVLQDDFLPAILCEYQLNEHNVQHMFFPLLI